MPRHYSSNTVNVEATTTSTTYQTYDTWSFEPKANTAYAIFASAQMYGTVTANRPHGFKVIIDGEDTIEQRYCMYNELPSRWWVGGVHVYEANSSPGSIEVETQFNVTHNGTCGINELTTIALELIDGVDYWDANTTNLRNELAGASGVDDDFATHTTITANTGNYLIIASGDHQSSYNYNQDNYMMHVWNDTDDIAYGDICNVGYNYALTSYTTYPYFWTGPIYVDGSKKLDIRQGHGYNVNYFSQVNRSCLIALNTDYHRENYGEYTEIPEGTSNTANVSLLSTTFDADGSNFLVIGSTMCEYPWSTVEADLYWEIDGTSTYEKSLYGQGYWGIGANWTENGNQYCNGYFGIHYLNGSTTINMIGSTNHTSYPFHNKSKNIIAMDLDTPGPAYVKNNSTWDISTAWVKDDGEWKKATPWIKDADEWIEVPQVSINVANQVSASNTYDTVWPDAPGGSPSPSPGPGGPQGTCFLPHQLVTMWDGELKPISDVRIGDRVKGRWGINTVVAYDMPKLGDYRNMWMLNGKMMNTPEHLTLTKNGWSVLNHSEYVKNDYNSAHAVIDDNGVAYFRNYNGVHPDKVSEHVIGETYLCTPDGGYELLTDMQELVGKYEPDQQLHSLVLDGCRTMYVDGICVSGWADETEVDYDAKFIKTSAD